MVELKSITPNAYANGSGTPRRGVVYTAMTAPLHVTLSAAQAATLRVAARAAFPHECCGLLVGEGAAEVSVTDVIHTANIAADPAQAFAVDPQAQFDVLRSLRGTARRVVGHYHSHPHGPAQPSPRDFAMAFDPQALWLLIAGEALRAFHRPAESEAFVEIPLVVSP